MPSAQLGCAAIGKSTGSNGDFTIKPLIQILLLGSAE